ncbi:hypothetical protein [Niallia taxi]|uniref:hypothetical protein n=1 Tax=Niallia taxi TaxID=2499688 RepID=UPI0025516202|nr:hypothetical protein [Niallia taxi]MDK8643495.1 hypothetical protein [Niallia taxi]
MEVLGSILAFLGMLGFITFLIMGLLALVKKNGTAKKKFKYSLMSLAVIIIAAVVVGATSDSTTSESASSKASEESAEEKQQAEEEAKKAEEEKVKAEAEAKAKAEEEAMAAAKAEEKAKKEAEEKKANAQPIEYAQFKKNPDRHTGEYVKYEGQIIQIMEGDDLTQIRLAVTQDSFGWNSNDLIFVEYDGLTDFVEEDVVTIYGEVYGSYNYESQAGWDITLPAVLADTIE